MKNTNLIYESPDKGKRVYEHIIESKLWAEIHRAAKTNVALADILEQAKIVYALIKKENN